MNTFSVTPALESRNASDNVSLIVSGAGGQAKRLLAFQVRGRLAIRDRDDLAASGACVIKPRVGGSSPPGGTRRRSPGAQQSLSEPSRPGGSFHTLDRRSGYGRENHRDRKRLSTVVLGIGPRRRRR